jgi:hypothetical protein
MNPRPLKGLGEGIEAIIACLSYSTMQGGLDTSKATLTSAYKIFFLNFMIIS